jgi:hypothetical protein
MVFSTRRRLGRALRFLAPLILLSILAPCTAYAYIDPGTGSLAWQLIVSTLIGGTFYARRGIRSAWSLVVHRVRGRRDSADKSERKRTPAAE